jgi:hypothetical protein
MTTVCAKDHGQSWTDPMGFWTKQRSRINGVFLQARLPADLLIVPTLRVVTQ